MIVFDAGILIKLFGQKTPAEEKQKLEYLVDTLQNTREQIAIPTPALSEYLVKAGFTPRTATSNAMRPWSELLHRA